MEFVIAVAVVAVAVYFAFFRKKDDNSSSAPSTPTTPPRPEYTEEELMKKTKAELIKLGAEMGLNLKSSDSKINLAIQIIAGKEGAHLL